MISDNESAFWADVNGDVIVDVKDIVRAKNLECFSSVDLLEIDTFANQGTIIKSAAHTR